LAALIHSFIAGIAMSPQRPAISAKIAAAVTSSGVDDAPSAT
jgi:hypothetical protein